MSEVVDISDGTSSPVGEKKRGLGGRPRQEVKRDKVVTCRLTPDEHAEFLKTSRGMKPNDFLRSVILRTKTQPKVIEAINREQWTQLAPVVANLNQLAHHANSGKLVSAELEPVLNELGEQLAAIRMALLGVEV